MVVAFVPVGVLELGLGLGLVVVLVLVVAELTDLERRLRRLERRRR
jgi:hypothetical protein